MSALENNLLMIARYISALTLIITIALQVQPDDLCQNKQSPRKNVFIPAHLYYYSALQRRAFA